ncbi:MAG: prepilin-type N-terminal cleavage/methylation domain-containing protein [Planctomycetes bacterium]|jgi:general secretion pathway protein G|nr:prepilin-type N-terminal cleavage/methylation domain-containing protein [Planctomycetota bacterium]
MAAYSSNRRGFTLIELMIVVGIIGVLVAVLLAVLMTARKKAKINEARNFVDTVVPTAITKWRDDKGKAGDKFPLSGANSNNDLFEGNALLFNALISDPGRAGKEAYISTDAYHEGTERNKKVFLDPWENPYRYRNWANAPKGAKSGAIIKYNDGTYDLVSSGPDGIWDNEDDIINGRESK